MTGVFVRRERTQKPSEEGTMKMEADWDDPSTRPGRNTKDCVHQKLGETHGTVSP